jgi:hypothetical protein
MLHMFQSNITLILHVIMNERWCSWFAMLNACLTPEVLHRPNLDKFTPLCIVHEQDMRGHTYLISRDAIEVCSLQPIAFLSYHRLHYILASFFCFCVSTTNVQPSLHTIVWAKSKSVKVAQSKVECQEGIPIHTFSLSTNLVQ